jgi:hypothetical protein
MLDGGGLCLLVLPTGTKLWLWRYQFDGSERRYRLDFKEERKLWDAIERCYMLEPDQRTVSNFATSSAS